MAGGHQDGYLVPLLPEPHDSGIDSDDTERARAQPVVDLLQFNETSSSDEDPMVKMPCMHASTKRILDEQLKNMEEGRLEHDVFIPMVQLQPQVDDTQNFPPDSPGRTSPLLYEVELTASDEDDDDSAMELVLPPSNYAGSFKRPRSPSSLLECITIMCTSLCFFDYIQE